MTEQEINQKYTELCIQLGDAEVKIEALTNKSSEIMKQIGELAKQLNELKTPVAGTAGETNENL